MFQFGKIIAKLVKFGGVVVAAAAGFIGGVVGSSAIMEKQMIVEWAEVGEEARAEMESSFPVLVMCDSKYSVGKLRGGDCTNIVTTVGDHDLRKINDDLAGTINHKTRGFPYFRIESEENGRVIVFVMEPTLQERVNKGWYSLEGGRLAPLRAVSYGPGQGIAAAPFGILGGVLCVAAYKRGLRVIGRYGGSTNVFTS